MSGAIDDFTDASTERLKSRLNTLREDIAFLDQSESWEHDMIISTLRDRGVKY